MFEMTELALHRLGKMWVSIMKRKIRTSRAIASGFLLESIKYDVVRDTNGDLRLQIQYADYWKYVNKGRKARGDDRPISPDNKSAGKPGAVPIPALRLWIEEKGLAGGDNSLSLAFAIRASIWKKGIRPRNFFDRSVMTLESLLDPNRLPSGTPPELRAELDAIFEAAREDINIILDKMIKKEIARI
jgi:hypothetical protein